MPVAGQVIRATDITNLVVPYYQASTGTTTWATLSGNVRQDVAGLTFDITTVNANAVVWVTWVVDFTVTTTVVGGNFQFRLEVAGVAQTPLAICSTVGLTRFTVAASMQVTHATPGTFTYKITGLATSATAAGSSATGLATLSALCIDKA